MKNVCIKQFTITMIVLLSAIQLQAKMPINESFIKNINTDGDETSCAFAGDSNLFIFARKIKGESNSDLYFSEFKNTKWTEALPVTVLNTDSDEISPYLSADGKYILFSSNRPGSLKRSSSDQPSYDIYYSEKTGDEWGEPQLLFGAVNTMDDEINPFITKDGTTLYFTRSPASNSSKTTVIRVSYINDSWEDIHTAEISNNTDTGIYMYKKSAYRSESFVSGFKKDIPGNRDIYFTSDSDSKLNELSDSTSPINSEGDEISVTELDENLVIIASNNNGIDGSYDFFIKKIKTDTSKSVREIFSVKIDYGNFKILNEIKIKVLFFSSLKKNSWPVRSENITPDASGIINIPAGNDIKRILILPGKPGIKSFAAEFLTANKRIKTLTIKIEPAVKTEFSQQPVYFKFNSSEIRLIDIPYIHSLIEYLRNNKTSRIILEGFSDGIGSYKANLDISRKRAENVKNYIIKAGIKKNRIMTKGLGYQKDKSLDTAQYNRRVDSTIIEE